MINVYFMISETMFYQKIKISPYSTQRVLFCFTNEIIATPSPSIVSVFFTLLHSLSARAPKGPRPSKHRERRSAGLPLLKMREHLRALSCSPFHRVSDPYSLTRRLFCGPVSAITCLCFFCAKYFTVMPLDGGQNANGNKQST
jgi:hypothetical protein